MKVERIAFEQLFPTGVYANQRLRIEVIPDGDSDESIYEAFETAKNLVNNAFEKLNPAMEFNNGVLSVSNNHDFTASTITNEEPKIDKIQSFIETIDMCTNLKFLEGLKKAVDRENNPALNEAYNTKHKSFQ